MPVAIPAILKEAHRLRRHLRELQQEIERGPRLMKAQQARLAAEQQAHKDAHDAVLKLKVKLREDEVTLKQINTQLAKFEKQLDDAGSPKEYEAKQSEIRQAKERIAAQEELILSEMESLENQIAALPSVDQQWVDAQAEHEQQKIDAKERLERMQADQKESHETLAKQEAQLPKDVKGDYDRLVKSYGPDGLAGVEGRSCQQCHMAITEQQRHDLTAGKFICCAQCGRGLYPASVG